MIRSRAYADDAAQARVEARLRDAQQKPRWIPLAPEQVTELIDTLEQPEADIANRRDTESALAAYIRDRFSAMPHEFADLLELADEIGRAHV